MGGFLQGSETQQNEFIWYLLLAAAAAASLTTSQCSGLVRWNFQASDNATLCQEAQQVACYLVLLPAAQS